MADPELYREKADVEPWKTRDPISVFQRKLGTDGLLTPERWTSAEVSVHGTALLVLEIDIPEVDLEIKLREILDAC